MSLVVDKVYRTRRGNQNQTAGLIITGDTASIQVYGSTRRPSTLDDMVDLTDSDVLDEGAWPFAMLPEYIAFKGTADQIDVVNMSAKDQNIAV